MSELTLPNRQQVPDLAASLSGLTREMESLTRLIRKQAVVLVADGQKNQRALLAQAARAAGFEQIMRVHHGAAALEYLYHNQVDMVLADWDVPVWGGIQLLDWVRCQPELNHLVFVMAASAEQERLLLQVAEERHDLFITKPFAVDILHERLPAVFARRQVVAGGRWQELQGSLQAARQAYLLAINNQPYRLWPYFTLGGLLGRNQRFAAAAQCFEHVQQMDAKAYAAPLNLARLKEMAGEEELSQSLYSQLIKKYPWFLKSYDVLAESFLRQEQPKRALAVLERAVHWGGSQHAPRLHRLAELYCRQNKENAAQPLLQKALHLRPWQDAGKKHELLAESYARQGDLSRAAEHARQGLEFSLEVKQSDQALSCLRLWGVLQLKQDNPEAALQTWSLAFDPAIWPHGQPPQSPRKLAGDLAKLAKAHGANSLAHHYYNLAQSLIGKGDGQWLHQRESRLAQLAAKGVELAQNGYLEEAEACYRQGLALSPDSARLCFNLAKLHYRQGKLDSYQRYLEAARRLNPQDEELLQEIERFYEQIRGA